MLKTQNFEAHWLRLLFHWVWTNENISFSTPKTHSFVKWHANYSFATVDPMFDSIPCYVFHVSSNYSSNFNNSFLIHYLSKNHEIFSIIFTWMSSIWLWFLINFFIGWILIGNYFLNMYAHLTPFAIPFVKLSWCIQWAWTFLWWN